MLVEHNLSKQASIGCWEVWSSELVGFQKGLVTGLLVLNAEAQREGVANGLSEAEATLDWLSKAGTVTD